MAVRVTAQDLPCYAVYSTDFHSSTEWGNKMIDLWCATKRAHQKEGFSVDVFRKELQIGIFDAADIRADFDQACEEAGADTDDDELFEEYEALHLPNAFDLIPSGLHAEFCWVPEWTTEDLDDLLYSYGLRSDKWKSSYIEDIQPGKWLEVFLKLVNCSSVDLIGEAIQINEDNGRSFAKKCAAANFKVERDQLRPSLMTPADVISAIENAYSQAVPMFHCEINVRALFEHDPTRAIRLTSEKKGTVHLGLHEFFNGAGYMDTYKGEVVIPADAVGFAGEDRWSYGINKAYGIVKSYFRATPIAV